MRSIHKSVILWALIAAACGTDKSQDTKRAPTGADDDQTAAETSAAEGDLATAETLDMTAVLADLEALGSLTNGDELAERGLKKSDGRRVIDALVNACGGPLGQIVGYIRQHRRQKMELIQTRQQHWANVPVRQRLTQVIRNRNQTLNQLFPQRDALVTECLNRLGTTYQAVLGQVQTARATAQQARGNVGQHARKIAQARAKKAKNTAWIQARVFNRFAISWDSVPADKQAFFAACASRPSKDGIKLCIRAVMVAWQREMVAAGTAATDPGLADGLRNAVNVELPSLPAFPDLPGLPGEDEILQNMPDLGNFESQLQAFEQQLAAYEAEAGQAKTEGEAAVVAAADQSLQPDGQE